MPQVKDGHYKFQHVGSHKFQLYYHTIKSALEINPATVLEIGIGQGIVTHVLKFNGVTVTTADFDRNLNPDVVCDIRKLPFEENAFDVVIASEILEHIPFDDVPKALNELYRVSSSYVILSVPYNQHYFCLRVDMKFNKYLYFSGKINKLLTKLFPFHFYCGISQKNRELVFDGEHYWEIGYKGFSYKRVTEVFKQFFSIEKDFRVPLSPYHYIFVLKKLPNR